MILTFFSDHRETPTNFSFQKNNDDEIWQYCGLSPVLSGVYFYIDVAPGFRIEKTIANNSPFRYDNTSTHQTCFISGRTRNGTKLSCEEVF